MLVVGPTGAGKSVLLALMALAVPALRAEPSYLVRQRPFEPRHGPGARRHFLRSRRRRSAVGGLAFQPLARIDDAAERAWAADWIGGLLAHEKVLVTPPVKETVWSALTSLASAPASQRTLTGPRGIGAVECAQGRAAALHGRRPVRPLARRRGTTACRTPTSSLRDGRADARAARWCRRCSPISSIASRPASTAGPRCMPIDEAWVFLDDPHVRAAPSRMAEGAAQEECRRCAGNSSLADIAALDRSRRR